MGFNKVYVRPPLYEKQEQAFFNDKRISATEGSTKAQPLSEPVLTPCGFVPMGDLSVGSEVFAPDGSVTTVAEIHPQGFKDVYELRFNDGTTARACVDHKWSVVDGHGRNRILTTRDIINFAVNTRKGLKFPLVDPVEFPERDVPVDPWFVGVLIGDGCLSAGTHIGFATADEYIRDRIQGLLPNGYHIHHDRRYKYLIRANDPGASKVRASGGIRFKAGKWEVSSGSRYLGRFDTKDDAISFKKSWLAEHYGDDFIDPDENILHRVAQTGLLGETCYTKRVPECYLTNSVGVRLAVLQGIMDTDGSAQYDGVTTATIHQTSKGLAQDIEFLVRSLGGVAKTVTIEPRKESWAVSYRTSVRLPNPKDCFSLPRKKERMSDQGLFHKRLLDVVRVEPEKCQCITVTHESHMYVTNDFTVTCNSGKSLRHSELVYSPNGPVGIGSLREGDCVLAVDGQPTMVTGVYPQGVLDVYRVTFSDGTTVDCSLDHLWEIESYDHDSKVVTTKDLIGLSDRFWVPRCSPVQMNERDVPIDPYVLGLSLGNGTNPDSFSLDAYKYNSVYVRDQLLRGFLGSNSVTTDVSGQTVFEQPSKELAKDVKEIVESLGGYVETTVRSVNGTGFVYSQVLHCGNDAEAYRRKVVSVDFVGRDECVCISVDHPRKLFLTRGFVPTHNTVAAMAYLFEKALIEGKKGRVYWWVAPIASQAEIAFRRMQNAIPFPELYTTNKNQMRITLANDAIMEFKTAERPDGLYGEDVFAAVIDEASRVPRESWHAVRSTLTATRGPVRMVGNVKGKNNWFYEVCRMAEEGAPNMHYTKLTAYDAVDAGVIDAEEIEDAKRVLPEAIFKELYLCEPSDAHGNPFGEDYIKRQLLKDANGRIIAAPQSGSWLLEGAPKPVAFGWDVAKTMNWTVGIGLDKDGRVVSLHRWRDNWENTINRMMAITDGVPAYFDSTGSGGGVEESLQRLGALNFRGFKFSQSSKQQLMELLAVGIQQGRVWYPDGRIVEELMSFEYNITAAGNFTYSAPRGYHDDSTDALAMAFKMFTENRHADLVAPIEFTRNSPWSI